MPDNAAKSFGRSASLDAAGSEQGAELCATAASNTSQHLLHTVGAPTCHSHHDRLASTFCRVQDPKGEFTLKLSSAARQRLRFSAAPPLFLPLLLASKNSGSSSSSSPSPSPSGIYFVSAPCIALARLCIVQLSRLSSALYLSGHVPHRTRTVHAYALSFLGSALLTPSSHWRTGSRACRHCQQYHQPEYLVRPKLGCPSSPV